MSSLLPLQREHPIDETAENLDATTIRFSDFNEKGKYKLALHIQKGGKIASVRIMPLRRIVRALNHVNPIIIASHKKNTALSQLNSHDSRRIAQCVWLVSDGQRAHDAQERAIKASDQHYCMYIDEDQKRLKQMKEGIAHWNEHQSCPRSNCAVNVPHYHRKSSYIGSYQEPDMIVVNIDDLEKERSLIYSLIEKYQSK